MRNDRYLELALERAASQFKSTTDRSDWEQIPGFLSLSPDTKSRECAHFIITTLLVLDDFQQSGPDEEIELRETVQSLFRDFEKLQGQISELSDNQRQLLDSWFSNGLEEVASTADKSFGSDEFARLDEWLSVDHRGPADDGTAPREWTGKLVRDLALDVHGWKQLLGMVNREQCGDIRKVKTRTWLDVIKLLILLFDDFYGGQDYGKEGKLEAFLALCGKAVDKSVGARRLTDLKIEARELPAPIIDWAYLRESEKILEDLVQNTKIK